MANEKHKWGAYRETTRKLSDENDKQSLADGIEKEEKKEKDEKQKKRMFVTKNHKKIARQTTKQRKE